MEINNNNSPYLHTLAEDKGDKIDKRVQYENKVSQVVARTGFSRAKIVENSLKKIIELQTMSSEISEDVNVALRLDSDESRQSPNEVVTQLRDNIPKLPAETTREIEINNEEMIKADSERLGTKCAEDVNRAAITADEVPPKSKPIVDVTPSRGESEFSLFDWKLHQSGIFCGVCFE